MKKYLSLFLAIAMAASVALVSCGKTDDPTPAPEPEPEVKVPEKQDVFLTASPLGATDITATVEAYADWKLEADETYDWVSASPTSGTIGRSTITFAAQENLTGKDRTATYLVYQGKALIYEILITQSKKDYACGDGEYAFLNQILEKNLLGENTPASIDFFNQESVNSFPGITMEVGTDGKLYIIKIEGATLTGFPTEINLPSLVRIALNNQEGLAGSELPATGNCPKLEYVALSHTKMTGVIPQWLADCPVLNQMYFDDTDFYGALPHIWKSKVIEVALIGSVTNFKSYATELADYQADVNCPYLGYIVPESLDVILNKDRQAQGDKTQMKVGGVRHKHWIGFEKGWGQARYERYDPAAVAGDKTVWSDARLLCGLEQAAYDAAVAANTGWKIEGYDANTDSWAWFFSGMGYAGEGWLGIEKKMVDWDQTKADAFTAAAKKAHDDKTVLDMTPFLN